MSGLHCKPGLVATVRAIIGDGKVGGLRLGDAMILELGDDDESDGSDRTCVLGSRSLFWRSCWDPAWSPPTREHALWAPSRLFSLAGRLEFGGLAQRK